MGIHPLAELSILLVDSGAMDQLHIQWMEEPGPTDVLSFPMDELRASIAGRGRQRRRQRAGLLGDIVLCPEVAEKQAKPPGTPPAHELELLTVHGILHLLGYDHADPEEEAEMFGCRPAPRRAARKRRAERVAAIARRFLRPLYAALGPVARVLDTVTRALPFGGQGGDPELNGRPGVEDLVDYIESQDEIEPDERAMVRSVVELGDTIVREVMVPRTDMVFVERNKTLNQALSLALRSGFSRIPVTGESTDDVVGIAYLKDIVAWMHEHPDTEESERVEKVMRPATYVPDSKPVDELLRQMQLQRIHVAIVIDEYGGTAGLATIEDILEEIVGEIADEYDNERAPVEWLAPGTARVTARLPVADLEDLFGVTVNAEDVETVGGLLAHELGRVPIAGSEATVAGLHLTAENLAGRRNKLGTVLIEQLPAQRPAKD
jgi:rRNA maturation RNase YbeY